MYPHSSPSFLEYTRNTNNSYHSEISCVNNQTISSETLPQNASATQSLPLATLARPCQEASILPRNNNNQSWIHNGDLSASEALRAAGQEISPENLPQNSIAANSIPSALSTSVRPCPDVSVRPTASNQPQMCNSDLSATHRRDEVPQSSWPGVSPGKLPHNTSALQTHPQNCIEQEGIIAYTKVPPSQRSLHHAPPSCPEQKQFLTNGPKPDPGSTFGIKPLISTDVPGLGVNQGYNPLSHLMSEPNSSDMGPTILSPSISLQGASKHASQPPTNGREIHPVLSPSGNLPKASNHGILKFPLQVG